MVHGELAPERVLELAARAGAVVAGPGLGRAPEAAAAGRCARARRRGAARARRRRALRAGGPARDAGGPRGPTALTPHAGELGRLLGRDSAAVGSARLASVSRGGGALGRRRAAEGPRHAGRGARRAAARRRDGGARSSPPPARATCSPARSARSARAGCRPPQALALAAVAHGSAARLAVADAGAILATDLLPAARAAARVTRSTLQVDLGAIRANARTPARRRRRQRGCGRSSRPTATGRAPSSARSAALAAGADAHLLRDARRGARAARRRSATRCADHRALAARAG